MYIQFYIYIYMYIYIYTYTQYYSHQFSYILYISLCEFLVDQGSNMPWTSAKPKLCRTWSACTASRALSERQFQFHTSHRQHRWDLVGRSMSKEALLICWFSFKHCGILQSSTNMLIYHSILQSIMLNRVGRGQSLFETQESVFELHIWTILGPSALLRLVICLELLGNIALASARPLWLCVRWSEANARYLAMFGIFWYQVCTEYWIVLPPARDMKWFGGIWD